MAYDAEIRVKTKIDNSEVIRLEAELEDVEKKADDAGDALKSVGMNHQAAEAAKEAASGMDELAQKTRKVAEETRQFKKVSDGARIRLADGSTFDWDGNLIEEAIDDTVKLENMNAKLAETTEKVEQSMREMGRETRQVNDAIRGIGEGAGDEVEKQITPLRNMLNFIKQSFKDIPIMFGGIASKSTASTRQMETEWDNLSDKAAHYKGVLEGLGRKGLGFGNTEYDAAYVQWQRAEQEVKEYKNQLAEVKKKHVDMVSGLKKVASSINRIFKKMGVAVKKFFATTNSGAKKTSGVMSALYSRFKGLALSLLIFNWISKGFNAMVSGIGEGYKRFAHYDKEFAASIQSLKNALSTLGNAFASAFSPVVQIAIPALVQLISWITAAVNSVAQLLAALSGKSTWKKATQVQAGYNDELDHTASSAKKAVGALAKFDDLDVWQKNNAAGSGGGADMGGGFEEIPIDPAYKEMADQIKEILTKFFEPLKEAWDREGQFVMDSWKYALDEIKKLAADIGRDFLTMWNQEATIQMFADILHIIGDIGLIVGHLAENLREAWNENNAGLRILEGIRDIFAVIVYNIRQAAGATVIWAEYLNFKPLLEAIAQYIDSLVPVFGTLSGIISDFYTQVLLPLGKWTIEEGLPEFLQIMTDFNEKVDWAKIRNELSDFWDHLEPFAETVGEGLLIFLRDLSDLVANFINSENLKDFLDHLKEWMDNVTPEDVAKGIKDLAAGLIELKVAITVLDAALSGAKLVASLLGLKRALSGTSTAANAAEMSTAGASASVEGFGLALSGAFTGDLINQIKLLFDNMERTQTIKSLEEEMRNLKTSFDDGKISQKEYETSLQNIFDRASAAYGIEELKTDVASVDDTMVEFGETSKTTLNEFEQSWKDAEESTKTSGENIGKNTVGGFTAGILSYGAATHEVLTGFFSDMIEKVKEILGIHSPSTVFFDIAVNMILGLLAGLQESYGLIVEALQMLFENISLFFTNLWTNVLDIFVTAWEAIKELASSIWTPIKEFFLEIWGEIRDKAVEVWEKVRSTFEEKMNKVKEKTMEIIKKFEAFRTSVKTVFEAVKSKIEETIKPVVDWIQSFIDKIRDAISAVKDFFASGFEKIGEVVGGIFDGGGRSRSMPASYDPEVSGYVSAAMARIPELASGAVIRGGNPFLAILGDQPVGRTNIEAPLSTIERAVENVMGRYGYSGINPTISLNLDGQEFARLTLQDILNEAARQGYNVEVLGVT